MLTAEQVEQARFALSHPPPPIPLRPSSSAHPPPPIPHATHSPSQCIGASAPPRPPSHQQYLNENNMLIEAIRQNQNLGRLHECVQYQFQLQQNLILLATAADEHPG